MRIKPTLKSHRPRGQTRTLRRNVLYAFKEAQGITKKQYRWTRNTNRHHTFDGGRRPLERKHPKKLLRKAELSHPLSEDTDAKIEFLYGHMIPSALHTISYAPRERGPIRRDQENARRVRQRTRLMRKALG